MNIPSSRHYHLSPYLLGILPIMVHKVGTIINDCIFGGLVSFLSPISPNWYCLNHIDTDVIYPFHIQHLLGLNLYTSTTILDYLNYLWYLQQSLKSFFASCNFIVLLKLLYIWNLIEIFKSAYWNNMWEPCQLIGKYNRI